MENLLIIGGGRWAKVIIDVVLSVTPVNVKVWVYSFHNTDQLIQWHKKQCNSNKRIAILKDRPTELSHIQGAIVVNSAKRHEEFARWLIKKKVPVLIEKPMTLSASATKNLIELAKKNETMLFPAHVFLFARHFENFKNYFELNQIKKIIVSWKDPKGETRYGEMKSFDPAVPIYVDWLPHVLTIASTLVDSQKLEFEGLSLERGGACVALKFSISSIPLEINLARNDQSRMRKITLELSNGQSTELDFAHGAGTIIRKQMHFPADPDWNSKSKPLASMLEAFLDAINQKGFDERLNSSLGLMVNNAIDATEPIYQREKAKWLLNSLGGCSELNRLQNLTYCLREHYYQNDIRDLEVISKIVDILLSYNAEFARELLKKSLTESIDLSMILRQVSEIKNIHSNDKLK